MKYSIIVGVYNQIKTLPLLVESIKAQTFTDFEVHFCDDGSDDGSYEWLSDADGRIERGEAWTFDYTIHRQKHEGMRLAKNLNQGINAAEGEYCVFVMADSMLEHDYLEILNEYVAQHRIVCGIRIQLDTIKGSLIAVDMDWRIKKGLVPEFPSVSIAAPWACLTGNGLTIPTEAFRDYGGWDEGLEGYGGEDNDIVARLFFKGFECWSIPDLRLYHHWHKSQEPNQASTERIMRNIARYELLK
jgi:glycosyltransferase EpsE